MEMDVLRRYLLAKPGTSEGFPFGPEVAVFKVMGKMFALTAWAERPLKVNLKCEPGHAEALRAMYPAVTPGYHMNKRHWNTVAFDGSIPEKEIWMMVDESYRLVAESLKKREREELARLTRSQA